MNIYYMFSERQKQLLVVDNYKFYKSHTSKQNIYTWRCIHKTCPAKAYTVGETTEICKLEDCTFQHSHTEENHLERQKASASCKRKAVENIPEKPAKIIRAELSKLESENDLTTADLNLIRRNIQNARSQVYKILPKTRLDLQNSVNALNIVTNSNEAFLMDNDISNEIVIFNCNSNIECWHQVMVNKLSILAKLCREKRERESGLINPITPAPTTFLFPLSTDEEIMSVVKIENGIEGSTVLEHFPNADAGDLVLEDPLADEKFEYELDRELGKDRLQQWLPVTVKEELDLDTAASSGGYDALLFVHWPKQNICSSKSSKVRTILSSYLEADSNLAGDVAIAPFPALGNKGRLVLSGTGKIDPDYDDVRSIRDAVHRGVKRALKAGVKKLLVELQPHPSFENAELVTILAVLEALHIPIQVREFNKPMPMLDYLGVYSSTKDNTTKVVKLAKALESGRRLAREIGEGDPERMSPIKVQEYVEAAFKGSSIKITAVHDEATFKKEYPLFEAVNRAATHVDRHKGRILYLEYNPNSINTITETLLLVGKGVTYDTGGADIKAGGIMAGMSRDKCGAAAVAGFMQVVDALQPTDIKVIAAMSLVRNSVGSNCYVADELIKARSGKLIRIGNTDAEGRMVMADVLCKLKEVALDAINPHLFTVATLTGHAHLTVGEGYSIGMDNGPARKADTSRRLQKYGDSIAEPFEISSIRREDMASHKGKMEGDDILQANNLPSSRSARGHQGPAGFLILTSGLDVHGSGDAKPLKYSHLDIAGSCGTIPEPATGAPVLALANAFLLNRK